MRVKQEDIRRQGRRTRQKNILFFFTTSRLSTCYRLVVRHKQNEIIEYVIVEMDKSGNNANQVVKN